MMRCAQSDQLHMLLQGSCYQLTFCGLCQVSIFAIEMNDLMYVVNFSHASGVGAFTRTKKDFNRTTHDTVQTPMELMVKPAKCLKSCAGRSVYELLACLLCSHVQLRQPDTEKSYGYGQLLLIRWHRSGADGIQSRTCAVEVNINIQCRPDWKFHSSAIHLKPKLL